MAKELVVLVDGQALGTLSQAANGALSFEYDDEWVSRVDPYPLSLSMPLQQKRHTNLPVRNFLLGLLPDNQKTLESIAQKHGVSVRSPFALISAVGEDLAGAVQMVPPSRVDTLKRREGIKPISEARLAQFLSDLLVDPGSTQINEGCGFFSLAEAQAKKAVYWVNGKWHEPRGRTPSTHIIKPPIPNFEGQVENEHFCLRLAQAMKLPVAASQVVSIGGKPNIVVERYDRARFHRGRRLKLTEPGGAVARLHQEDMCQALAIDPAHKYQGADGGPGMKAIMQVLSGSGNPTLDRGRFMRACAFNYVILGTDAHGKNYSVLIDHDQFRLAPLYDINSMLAYDPERARKLAMSVGGEPRWRRIGPSEWRKAASACNFPGDVALSNVREIVLEAPDAAEGILKKCRDDGLKTPVLTKLTEEIVKRCKALQPFYQ